MIPLLRTGSKGQARPGHRWFIRCLVQKGTVLLDWVEGGSPWGRQFALPAENSILKLWGLTWEPLMPGPGP